MNGFSGTGNGQYSNTYNSMRTCGEYLHRKDLHSAMVMVGDLISVLSFSTYRRMKFKYHLLKLQVFLMLEYLRFVVLSAVTMISLLSWAYVLCSQRSKEHFILNHLEMSEAPFDKTDHGSFIFRFFFPSQY